MQRFCGWILKSLTKSDPLPSPLVSTSRGICHKDGRLFIPSSFVKNILFASHDKSGHFSAPYVKRTITRSCYWPSMSQDIENYIASCDICARVNPAIPKTIVPLQPVKPVARAVSYTHLRAHETRHDLVCRLLLEK